MREKLIPLIKTLKFRYIVATGWALVLLSFLYGQANLSLFYSNSDKFVNMWLSSGSSYLREDLRIDKRGKLVLDREVPTRFKTQSEQLFIFDRRRNLLFETNPEHSLSSHIRNQWLENDRFEEFTIDEKNLSYFIGVKHYVGTQKLPALIFVTVKEHHSIDPDFFADVDQNFQYIKMIFALHISLIIPLVWFFSSWSLRPIKKINAQLIALKRGEADELDSNVVGELLPLVVSLNDLISFERQQKEKQRQLLSDLSHGLKTPLSVLQGAARSHSLGIALHQNKTIEMVINQEVKNMVDQIQHRLKVTSNEQGSVLFKANEQVSEIIDLLVFGMKKIHATKDVSFKLSVPADVMFLGHRNDLMEVAGNLLDNACKYGHGMVHVSAFMKQSKSLHIVIEDDGLGVTKEQKMKLGDRGVRLDCRAQGYGLGINITQDILRNYQGKLFIEDSNLGGAKFTAVFEDQEGLDLR
ncbi:putative Virulence sensor histidine kinase phoQ [Vibrio coralliirubri]|uniref:ATP-binding protein n=1 Tax=Vibrio coralliirubri TaxID=1516159 RepID=UPI00062F2D06|nr:ATP-binding protein [Vibrio coralliirubri]CDT91066.1 putative Virulence sensor histidine kinase phoQ [Vibrio coralliirubri]